MATYDATLAPTTTALLGAREARPAMLVNQQNAKPPPRVISSDTPIVRR